MFQAMQAGAGSLSTTHAYSARSAIERLVTCATAAGGHVSETFAYRQVAEHVDLIVQITLEDTTTSRGVVRRRYVSEVTAVEPGENGQPAVTDVYRPGPDGRAVPGTLPQWLTGLAGHGFDVAGFRGQVVT
jgi:Flp pilus assembly CpaF family ATPase